MNDYLNKNKSLKNKKDITKKDKIIFCSKVILLFCIFFVGILYLFQINKISTKGYEISRLESENSQLEYDNKIIEVQIASFTSLDSLKDRLKDKKMLAINDIKYLNVVDNNIAQR